MVAIAQVPLVGPIDCIMVSTKELVVGPFHVVTGKPIVEHVVVRSKRFSVGKSAVKYIFVVGALRAASSNNTVWRIPKNFIPGTFSK